MFATGDIVKIFGSTAGHIKYHLCICECDEHGVTKFLFINSHEGWDGDYVLSNGQVPCIPASDTGISVISCNVVVRYNDKQLSIFRAVKIGELESCLVESLIKHVNLCKALSRPEKALVVAKLGSYLAGQASGA